MWLFDVISSLITGVKDLLATDVQVPQILLEAFHLAASPLTFSWVATAQFFFQGLALAACVLIIIVKGLTSNIMIPGTSGERGLVNYVWRSSWPILVIVATPTILNLVCGLAFSIANSLTSDVSADLISGFLNAALWAMWPGAVGKVVLIVLYFVCLFYTISVFLQCIKRQVQLVILSIIAPLVAVATVSENNAGDFIVIIKEMVGIGVTTALQILLLLTAYTIPLQLDFAITFGLLAPLVLVGFFSAIKQCPKWIERYTLAPSVSGGSGRMGSMVGGAAARGAVMKAMG